MVEAIISPLHYGSLNNSMPVKIGTTIDERYRVVGRIGHGGMAEVYEANDIISRKAVAIKFILEDVMKNPVNLKRFTNEATIMASLNHPNIVRVYNHGTYEGRPYIVSEYVKGQTLKDVLDFRSSLPVSEALSIMLQLTSALQYAHDHNIIHRDIKPQNIFLMQDGTIKLGDFGIAEAEGLDIHNPTETREIVGSVHYIAPEIAKGKPASNQTDIYSAGVTFFELITGHVPFAQGDAVAIAIAHIKDKFPSPKKYLPNCPREVEKIIDKATKKKPNERYKCAADFYSDLYELKNHPELFKEKKSFLAKIFGFK